MGLLKTDTWLTVGTSSVLILMYGTTLIKVCTGSKYEFFIKLLLWENTTQTYAFTKIDSIKSISETSFTHFKQHKLNSI